MAGEGQTTGDKVVADINQVTQVIGTLVPTIGAIGGMIRLIATAVRPTDAQKAQAFDAAIADYDAAAAGLASAINGFEDAKKAAESRLAAGATGGPVAGMTTKSSGAAAKPSDG